MDVTEVSEVIHSWRSSVKRETTTERTKPV
ncbi:hypothetical protein EYF80_066574 [Liparis tanakae]|uniref:Uncharacterized protein n=1 Tax=Liparis tanakae TaxID=230148 RepID=A0A4Z2E3L1_9TELE|nr:hypothetical protein EYF80_066574 [Liparis tanakae]